MENVDYDSIKKLKANKIRVDNALKFTKKNGPQDETHNIDHHVRVVNKAIQAFLFLDSKDQDFIDDVLVVCAIHDCVDRKYPEIKEKNIELVRNKFGKDILEVVSNMSWSHNEELDDEYWNRVKNFAQQADWWDAIDIQRCIDYTTEKNESLDNVITYYNIKLKFIWGFLDDTYQILSLTDHEKMEKDYKKFISDYF